jgi:hypothetical protein
MLVNITKMKKLLINGCSFVEYWQLSDQFIKSAGCDEVVNLGKAGTSFQRTVRSTVEWISQNGNPAFVMIALTFAHRWELALNKDEDEIDGSWVPLQNSNFLHDSYNLQDSSIHDIQKLCDDYYKIIPTIKTHWDKMFTDLITFTGFLESNNIPYLVWDMSNGFDKQHIRGYKGFNKIKLIEQNKRIIDLWEFCGNRYMRNTMPEDIKKDTPEYAHHHEPEQHRHLEKYITNYLKTI